MSAITNLDRTQRTTCEPAPFFIRGKLVEGSEVLHRSRDLGVDFATPKRYLDAVIAPRTEPGPLFDVKLAEIIDFIFERGQHLALEKH